MAVATGEKPAPEPVPADDHDSASSPDPAPPLLRWARNPAVVIGLILVVAAVLRFIQLGHDSLWIDEVTVAYRSQPHRLFSQARDAGALEPPASYLVTAASLQLPLSIEAAVRLPMAIFGVLEVFALYLLARELSRRAAVGLIAAALLAVAPFAVRYSQEARYYVMFSALHLFSWWLLLRALRRRRTRDWLALGACNGLLLLTHQYAVVVVSVEVGVLVVVALREWRAMPKSGRAIASAAAISFAVAAAFELPWMLYSLPKSWSDGRVLTPDVAGGRGITIDLDLAKRGADFLFGNDIRVTALAVVLAGLCIAAPFLTRCHDRRVALAVAAYSAVFALVIVIIGRAIGTYYAFRRIEFLLPLLLLLAAFAIVGAYDRLRQLKPARQFARPALAIGLIAIVAVSMTRTIAYYGTEKTNLRAVAQLGRSAPETTIVATFCVPVETDKGFFGDPVTRGTWERRLTEYWAAHGLDRRPVIIDSDHPAPTVTPGPTGVLLFSGIPTSAPGWDVRPLNRLDRLQLIAGDQDFGQLVIPIYAIRGAPANDAELSSVIESLRTTFSTTRHCAARAL